MLAIAFSLTAAVCWGMVNILVSKANERMNPTTAAFLSIFPSFAVVVTAAVVTGQITSLGQAGLLGFVYYAGAGLMNYALARILNFHSIRAVGASRSASITTGRILLGTIIALFVLNEAITLQIGLGVTMLLVGVYMTTRGE